MVIEGLRLPEETAVTPVVNVSDRAALALESLKVVGRINDQDETLDTITQSLEQLDRRVGAASTDVYSYPQLTFGTGFTPLDMLRAIDGAKYPDSKEYPVT